MPGNAVLSAPAGISDEIAAKLEAAAKKAMDDPDFTKILQRIQFPKAWLSSAELVKFTAEVTPGIKKVVAATQ